MGKWGNVKRRFKDGYFLTDKPCKRGHRAEREPGGGCAECRRIYYRARYRRNKTNARFVEKRRKRSREYYRSHRTERIAAKRRWLAGKYLRRRHIGVKEKARKHNGGSP